MSNYNCSRNIIFPFITTLLLQVISLNSHANNTENDFEHLSSLHCKTYLADRLFDGEVLRNHAAIMITGKKIRRVGTAEELSGLCLHEINLGDATIMPGFIESHAHVTFQDVPQYKVLQHGITTARDVGGPLLKSIGGIGELRLLSSGPIIQAPGGYPLILFGSSNEDAHHASNIVGVEADSPEEGRRLVQHFYEAGAVIIKISLEPGGEQGAPWSSSGHGHGGENTGLPWPILSEETTIAIVEEAHSLGLRVTAHVGENTGVERALIAGVDEYTHIPCAGIEPSLLQRAVDQGVTFVTTLDTLSACHGIDNNAHALAYLGAEFIYGSEIGHNDVPWGINAEELNRMLSLTGMEVIDLFKSATSHAGKNLDIPLLGNLTKGAPADVIAVKGNPFEKFKLLEYPDLVISGGKIVVNNFSKYNKNHIEDR